MPEVIVLTHAGARRAEWSPYMATACRPHVPVVVFGRSANTDVIVASAQAYLNAVNRLISLRNTKEGQVQAIHPQFNSLA